MKGCKFRGCRFEGGRGWRWFRGGGDGSVSGYGVLVKFSLKPNPSSSKCTIFFYLFICHLPEEVKRNVQKFHVLTEKESIEERKRESYLPKGGTTLNLYLHAARDRFHGYLSHSRRMFSRFFYTSAFWLFSSTFSSSFFSSSEEPFSFSPVFQLPCLFQKGKKKLKKKDEMWNRMISPVTSPKDLFCVSILRNISTNCLFLHLPKSMRFVESFNHD